MPGRGLVGFSLYADRSPLCFRFFCTMAMGRIHTFVFPCLQQSSITMHGENRCSLSPSLGPLVVVMSYK